MSNLSLQFSSHNQDALSVLSLNEVPLPPLPKGHVRVEVKARAVNPADVLFVQGLYDNLVGDRLQAGEKFQTGGSEASGVIVALGEGVAQHLKVGQRVYAGSTAPRTRAWARFMDVEASSVVPIPDSVSFASAAQLLINPLTAIGFLETMVADGLQDEDFYVLTAGNSALCKMVLQLARLRKLTYRAICIVRSSSVKAELLALGAFAVIAQDETPDVPAAVHKIAPHGVKATFDALGGGQVAASLIGTLARGGSHYVYGLLTPEPLTLPVNSIADMLFRTTRLQGWFLGAFLGKHYARVPALFGEVLGYLSRGELVFKSKEFDFEKEWKEAISYTMDGSKQGKTILASK